MKFVSYPLLDGCNKQFGFNKLRIMEENHAKWENCAYKSGGHERVKLTEVETNFESALMLLDTPKNQGF